MSAEERPIQPAEFDSVWLSSPDHLDRFERIVNQISWFKRLLGLYSIPQGFPRIRQVSVLPWRRAQYEPAVCFSVGKLLLRPQQLCFLTSRRDGPIARRLENLNVLRLEIDLAEVKSVEPYTPPAVVTSFNRLAWIRMRTFQSGIAGDLLLCIGGFVLSKQSLSEENTRLFHTLAQVVV